MKNKIIIRCFWIGFKQSFIDRKEGRNKKRLRNLFFYSFKTCPCRTCIKEMNNMLGSGYGFTFFQIFGFYIAFLRNLQKNELIIREQYKLPYITKILDYEE
jgi:hypothetical protein